LPETSVSFIGIARGILSKFIALLFSRDACAKLWRAGRTAETGHCADMCRPVNMLWHIYALPASDRFLFARNDQGAGVLGWGPECDCQRYLNRKQHRRF
jgi:hypothetical protein